VLSNPKWQKAALFLNLVGTIVLFYSFQATSSDFKLVTAPYEIHDVHPFFIGPQGIPPHGTKQYALCVNDFTIISSDIHSTVELGHAGCPNWAGAKPAAVVNIEHPTFEGIGFAMIALGFTLQYFSVPQAATITHLRKQLKAAKMREKANSKT
jgi:hypothetical protein